MATKTRARKRTAKKTTKATKRKPAKRNGKPSNNGLPDTAVIKGTGDDPRQELLPGVESDRIEEIDKVFECIVTTKSKKDANSEKLKKEVGKLAALMHKHEVREYRWNGKVAHLRPGEDVVQIKSAKER